MTIESGPPAGPADWDAIARFFAGESSDAEIESVSKWLADHPDEAAALTALGAVTGPSREDPASKIDVEAAWRRTVAQLDAQQAGEVVERSNGADPGVRSAPRVYAFPARRSVFSSPPLRAAAAIALIASGAVIWTARKDGSHDTAPAAGRTFATAPAQRDSVVLEDGTGVLLGPGSSLRTEAGYGDRRRFVHLEGEALFDVRHDNARPFVVHTSGLLIHDLGTTFTVRTTNDTTGITKVAVTVGAVRVARARPGADSGVILRKGDMAAVGAGPIAVQRGVALDDELAWTRGRLVFRDTPLPAVASALRRWYGVRVEIGDPALNLRTLTASFEGESLPQVLEVIRLAIGAPVRQADSLVIIGAPLTPARSPR